MIAAAIDLDMAAIVSKREDSRVCLVSEGFGTVELDISDTSPRAEESGTSQALIRGLAAALQARGYDPGGFDAYLTSNIPVGSGLSSSAAFEVLMGKVFSALYCGDSLSPEVLAQMGQYAENEYFGKPCGLMDQLACALGGVVFLDFFKEGAPKAERLSFDFEAHGYGLFITNAGGSHVNLTEDYAAIPAEMRGIARCFGAEKLSRVEEAAFWQELPALRSRVSDRALLRAMHFFDENRRVREQLPHLRAGDIGAYLKRMAESGRSSLGLLQNLWPENRAERSLTLALAVSEKLLSGQGASRVHGGGFAGTIQALVPLEMGENYEAEMNRIFGAGACRALCLRDFGAQELR